MDESLNPQRIRWHSRLRYVPTDASEPQNTDKVLLPESVLESLMQQVHDEPLPSPLIFRIASMRNDRFTHVGIREFSAEEGTIAIPSTVRNLLDLEIGQPVSCEFTVLPRATSLRVKPLRDDYGVDDWKVMLEAQLNTTHTALTKGDVLTVADPLRKNNSFELLVEDLQPADAACIVDTDVVLEIVSDTVQSPKMGPTEVEAEQTVNFRIADPATDAKIELTKWDRSKPLYLETTCNAPEPSSVILFVGIGEETSSENFVWSSLADPGCVTIGANETPLEGSLWISAHSELDPVSVSLSVTQTLPASTSTTSTADSKQCENCKQLIPTQSFQLHTTFCARNNIVCPDCSRVFQRRREAGGSSGIPASHWHCHDHSVNGDSSFSHHIHDQYLHTATPECGCGKSFANQVAVARHRALECPMSLHICRFCHLKLPREDPTASDTLNGLSGHEGKCGARTTDCELCGRSVRLIELASHMDLHDMQRRTRLAPRLCANINCIRPATSKTNTNSLGLCDQCFGPLYNSMYDPDGSKLRSRIERRYVIQLTKGCGRTSCMNEFCKSGNPVAQTKPFAEQIKAAKELTTRADADHTFAFCVDDMTTKRRMFADLESSEGEYSREWCAAAIDAARGNETDAKRWLRSNAVKVSE